MCNLYIATSVNVSYEKNVNTHMYTHTSMRRITKQKLLFFHLTFRRGPSSSLFLLLACLRKTDVSFDYRRLLFSHNVILMGRHSTTTTTYDAWIRKWQIINDCRYVHLYDRMTLFSTNKFNVISCFF